MSDRPKATDWIAAVSAVVATVVGLVTLLTVYIGAMQLLSQSRMYRAGLSWRSVGPWQSTVAKSRLLGLQKRITTPSISPKMLVRKHWTPNLTFPTGFSRYQSVEAGDHFQAKASWVNFLQGLGLSLEDNDLYEMQDASDLINGVVPMHWTGQDLVGICSILGFQSHEESPSFSSPMPLPMQWMSPIGRLQFRSSNNGCIAEFRRRMDQPNQIPTYVYTAFRNVRLPQGPQFLLSRLWNSMAGLLLSDGRTLYLGAYIDDLQEDDDLDANQSNVYEQLMSRDLRTDEILGKLFGKKETRTEALRRQAGANMTRRPPDSDDSNSSPQDGEMKEVEVLTRRRGLLSVVLEGELAYNRGLSIANCEEYERIGTKLKDVDYTKYPYKLGDLYMDIELLSLMKEALLLLCPDGYVFTAASRLYSDISEVYEHIGKQFSKMKEDFPSVPLPPKRDESIEILHFALRLCNELRRTRRTYYSIGDMGVITRATEAMKMILARADGYGTDLVWAIIFCPQMCPDLLETLKTANISNFLATNVTSRAGILDCTGLVQVVAQRPEDEERPGQYAIPLLDDADFTGMHVLAALVAVFLTQFWLDRGWVSDVAPYDFTMPQSILML